jgi:hypothetical protein
MARIFIDGFENGDLSNWSYAGAAPPLISTTQKYTGTRSAKIYSYIDVMPWPGTNNKGV